MNIDEWRSQIKRGTLEFCVLLLISRAPRYGYEIISRLESRPIVAAKESTVYPLLRRLQKDGCLTSFWQETAEGLPPRKYYTITDAGRGIPGGHAERVERAVRDYRGLGKGR